MPARNRPAKRVLNRWSDDLDKGVLLCVQYACAEAGLKIPWGRVAALMGPTFTEGSIVQHLAKLRHLMAKNGIPVPPAVKRGMVTKEPSKIYTNAGNKVKVEAIPPMFPEAPSVKEEADDTSIYDKPKRTRKKEAPKEKEAPVKKEAKANAKGKGKAKGRRHLANDEEDDNEPIPDLDDSDDEYPPPKKRRSNGRSKKKEAAAKVSTTMHDIPSVVSPIEAPGADKVVAVKHEDEELTSRRTRGIKRDYSVMAAPSDDDAEVDEDIPGYMAEDPEDGYEDIEVDNVNAYSGSIDDDMDEDSSEVSSEVSTVVLGHQQNVANLPYGQIMSTMDGHPTQFTHLNMANPASYGLHGHLGAGVINRNPYSAPELGYSGAATMSTMPYANPVSQFQSISLYGSSVDSSRNNSIGADMIFPALPTLPTMSDEFLTAHTGFGHSNTGDMINEEDMVNNMANDDMFWDEAEYLVDDA